MADPNRNEGQGRPLRGVAACVIAATLLAGLGGCGVLDHGFLGAAGPVADRTRTLFFIACFILLFVVGPVIVLTPIIAWHYRLSNTKSAYRPQWGFNWPLEGLIWIPPVLIVVALAVFVWRDTHALDPYKPLASAKPPVEVQVVALDWKWLFIYPEEGVASVNELAFPAERPIHLSLTSATVLQTFFIPKLGGQIDVMAGMTTQHNLAAAEPARLWGQNTQFNGRGFQDQKFPVLAQSADDYAAWVARARAGGKTLDMNAFKALSARSVQPEPIQFGSVVPGLFKSILGLNGPGLHDSHEEMHR